MTKQKIKTKITENSFGYRYFIIFVFEQTDANKIIEFLKADPLVEYRKRGKYSRNPKYYIRVVFFYNGNYQLHVISSSEVFALIDNFHDSKGVKSTIDYLFKIMTPQQKVKLSYWLENID